MKWGGDKLPVLPETEVILDSFSNKQISLRKTFPKIFKIRLKKNAVYIL